MHYLRVSWASNLRCCRAGETGETWCADPKEQYRAWSGNTQDSSHVKLPLTRPGPILNYSPILGRDIFRIAQKERTQRVQLHVGLREGSPGALRSTQRLLLGPRSRRAPRPPKVKEKPRLPRPRDPPPIGRRPRRAAEHKQRRLAPIGRSGEGAGRPGRRAIGRPQEGGF